MGVFKFVLEAIGPHHTGQPIDADKLLSKVTADLADSGHTISSAVLHRSDGAQHDLVAAPTHLPPPPPTGEELQADTGAQQGGTTRSEEQPAETAAW